ncbi:hypothetical protein LXL04_028908 [Taraxacum kok-saghyz]
MLGFVLQLDRFPLHEYVISYPANEILTSFESLQDINLDLVLYFSCPYKVIDEMLIKFVCGEWSRMAYLMEFQRQGQNGLFHNVSPVSPVMDPMGAAQSAAKELLDSILDAIVQIFDNYAVVGEFLESKSSQHAAMNTPKSMVATISGIPDSKASKDTRGYCSFSFFFSLDFN